MARSAYREAVGSFEQALEALMHLPESPSHLGAGRRSPARPPLSALSVGRNWRRILALVREAEALAAALDDPRRLGQVSVSATPTP